MIDRNSIRLAKLVNINLRNGHRTGKDGRFMLVKPIGYPACHALGNALRSRVVWWLNTGEALTGLAFHIHHINHNNTDDRIENLQKISHSDHSKLHATKAGAHVSLKCKGCKNIFTIERWRLKDKCSGRGKYCSQQCYQAQPKSSSSSIKISNSLRLAYAEGRRA